MIEISTIVFRKQFLPIFVHAFMTFFAKSRLFCDDCFNIFIWFCFYKEQKYHCESFVNGRTRGFCVMHRQHTAWESTGSGMRRREGMLLDQNLVSVVRDAPYAVDHLSARSQRPIISRDTCASPPR